MKSPYLACTFLLIVTTVSACSWIGPDVNYLGELELSENSNRLFLALKPTRGGIDEVESILNLQTRKLEKRNSEDNRIFETQPTSFPQDYTNLVTQEGNKLSLYSWQIQNSSGNIILNQTIILPIVFNTEYKPESTEFFVSEKLNRAYLFSKYLNLYNFNSSYYLSISTLNNTLDTIQKFIDIPTSILDLFSVFDTEQLLYSSPRTSCNFETYLHFNETDIEILAEGSDRRSLVIDIRNQNIITAHSVRLNNSYFHQIQVINYLNLNFSLWNLSQDNIDSFITIREYAYIPLLMIISTIFILSFLISIKRKRSSIDFD